MSPTDSAKIPVWLDCDPGHDDTFAIVFAAFHPAIHLLGLSTVYGNSSIEKTTENAASILTSISKHEDIPVFAGASHGIARSPMHPPADIHGESGIDGTTLLLPPLKPPNTTDDAVDAMAKALMSQPAGTAYIIATGSFTNVALLIQRHPQVITHIKGLSVMGGVFGGGFTDHPTGTVDDIKRIGNYTPWAEFNVIADPEAAAAVFSNQKLAVKTTVAPLDLTHQVLATEEIQDLLLYGPRGEKTGKGKTVLRQMLVELLLFFAKTYADIYGLTSGPPLHDPLAVAAILQGTPHEIKFYDFDTRKSENAKLRERFSVSVDTEGSYEDAVAGKTQTGRTTLKKLQPGENGVTIPRGVDVSHFWRVLEDCIQRADEANAAFHDSYMSV